MIIGTHNTFISLVYKQHLRMLRVIDAQLDNAVMSTWVSVLMVIYVFPGVQRFVHVAQCDVTNRLSKHILDL